MSLHQDQDHLSERTVVHDPRARGPVEHGTPSGIPALRGVRATRTPCTDTPASTGQDDWSAGASAARRRPPRESVASSLSAPAGSTGLPAAVLLACSGADGR